MSSHDIVTRARNPGSGGINEGRIAKYTHLDHSAGSHFRSPGFHSPLSQMSAIETSSLRPVITRANALLQQNSTCAPNPPPHFRIFGLMTAILNYCVPPAVFFFFLAAKHAHTSHPIYTSSQCALCAQERRIPGPARIYRSCTCISGVPTGEEVRTDYSDQSSVFFRRSFPEASFVDAHFFCALGAQPTNSRDRHAASREMSCAWPNRLSWTGSHPLFYFPLTFGVLPPRNSLCWLAPKSVPRGMWCEVSAACGMPFFSCAAFAMNGKALHCIVEARFSAA